MKTKWVLVGVTFLPLMRVTPASAAPREIEYFCFEQAQQVPTAISDTWEEQTNGLGVGAA